jgi:hypothetical protein
MKKKNCKCCNRNITELKEDLGGLCRRCHKFGMKETEKILKWKPMMDKHKKIMSKLFQDPEIIEMLQNLKWKIRYDVLKKAIDEGIEKLTVYQDYNMDKAVVLWSDIEELKEKL